MGRHTRKGKLHVHETEKLKTVLKGSDTLLNMKSNHMNTFDELIALDRARARHTGASAHEGGAKDGRIRADHFCELFAIAAIDGSNITNAEASNILGVSEKTISKLKRRNDWTLLRFDAVRYRQFEARALGTQILYAGGFVFDVRTGECNRMIRTK